MMRADVALLWRLEQKEAEIFQVSGLGFCLPWLGSRVAFAGDGGFVAGGTGAGDAVEGFQAAS